MRWLFFTGISLDISGAIMVLGAILTARPSEVAKEAVQYTGYNDARLRARAQERRFAISGAALLASGFLFQLAGYAWAFSSWWLLVYSLGLAVVVTLLALFAVKRSRSRFYDRAADLMKRAVE